MLIPNILNVSYFIQDKNSKYQPAEYPTFTAFEFLEIQHSECQVFFSLESSKFSQARYP